MEKFLRCWKIPSSSSNMQGNNSFGLTQQLYLQQQILKTLQELTKKRKKKKKEKNEKGKNVPGKNLSKNSQCDGNDDDLSQPGPSKGVPKKGKKMVTRRAAKKAAVSIAKQSELVDGNMAPGDKNFEPEHEQESDSDSEPESESEAEDDLDSNAFGTAQEEQEEPAERLRQTMPSIDPVHYHADDEKYSWVESFELDLNSKRHQKHICQLVISLSFLSQSTS